MTPGVRCNCEDSMVYDIQCVHELVMDDKFVINKWGARHLKEDVFKRHIGYNYSQNIHPHSSPCLTNDGSTVPSSSALSAKRTLNFDEESHIGNSVIDLEGSIDGSIILNDRSSKIITHRKLMETFSEVVNIAVRNPKYAEGLLGTILCIK